MNLLDLFRNKAERADEVVSKSDDNPFLNARRSMNEQTGAIISSRQIWQAVALIAMITTIGAVGGLIHIGSQSKFIPYIIEVDKLGQIAAVKPVGRAQAVDGRIIHATIAAFVSDVRMVSFDHNVQNEAIWKVFSHLQSNDPSTTKITDFMTDPHTNPTKKAEEFSVGVEVSSVLQQTHETWEVTWTERVWDRKGVRVDQYKMRGLLTIYIVPPTTSTTEEEIRRNPLGIFVRDFTWSRVLE